MCDINLRKVINFRVGTCNSLTDIRPVYEIKVLISYTNTFIQLSYWAIDREYEVSLPGKALGMLVESLEGLLSN